MNITITNGIRKVTLVDNAVPAKAYAVVPNNTIRAIAAVSVVAFTVAGSSGQLQVGSLEQNMQDGVLDYTLPVASPASVDAYINGVWVRTTMPDVVTVRIAEPGYTAGMISSSDFLKIRYFYTP